MLQFGIIPTSEFLHLITNHATDAIKAVVLTVNMKFRKLKKNNARNTNKLTKFDNLYKIFRASARIVLRVHSRRHAALGSRTRKFCGNKTSTGC